LILLLKNKLNLRNRRCGFNLVDLHFGHCIFNRLLVVKIILCIFVLNVQITPCLVSQRLHALVLLNFVHSDWNLAVACWNIFLRELAHFEHWFRGSCRQFFWVFRSRTRLVTFLKITYWRGSVWRNTAATLLWSQLLRWYHRYMDLQVLIDSSWTLWLPSIVTSGTYHLFVRLWIINFDLILLNFDLWYLLLETWCAYLDSFWLSLDPILLLNLKTGERFLRLLSEHLSFDHVSTVYHLHHGWLRLLNVEMYRPLSFSLRLKGYNLLLNLVICLLLLEMSSLLSIRDPFVIHIFWETVLGILPLLKYILFGNHSFPLWSLLAIIWDVFVITRHLILLVEVFV
jgi:hypothetical protein